MKKLGKIELYKILYKVVLLQLDTYIEQQQQQQQQNTFIQTATHDTQELLEVHGYHIHKCSKVAQLDVYKFNWATYVMWCSIFPCLGVHIHPPPELSWTLV